MMYSVFVGKLMPTVTKEDLYPLFSGFGEIKEIHVCVNKERLSYSCAFVRYMKLDSALKAVSELHRWEFFGTRIVVDLAKETAERLKYEKKLNSDKMVTSTQPTSPPRPYMKSDVGLKSTLVQDIMYLSRIKESCTSLNYQVTSGTLGDDTTSKLNVDKLLGKMAATSVNRVKPTNGEFTEDITPEKIKEKLITSGRNQVNVGSKAYEFMNALQKVLGTMNSFLNEEKPESDISPVKENSCQEKRKAEISTSPVKDPLQSTEDCINEKKVVCSSDNVGRAKSTVERLKPDICSALHVHPNEVQSQNLKVIEDSSDNKDLLKQFFFKSSACGEFSQNKCREEKDLDLSRFIKISGSTLPVNSSPSEEVLDTSNSDSDTEGFSRDSGIESDLMSGRKYKTVPDQMPPNRSNGEVAAFKGTSSVEACNESFEETSPQQVCDGERSKMDDIAVIQSFLHKALNIGSDEGSSKLHAVTMNQMEPKTPRSTEPSLPYFQAFGRGFGRGSLGLLKK